MKKFRVVFVVVLLASYTAGVYAARPFSTDDAGVVAPGKFELEAGYEFGDIAGTGHGNIGLGFKHGLTEKMDIGIGLSHVCAPVQLEGLEAAELSLKFALLPDLFAVSFNGGFGASAYGLSSILTLGLDPVELDINLGYGATGISDEHGSISYALALIYGLGKVDMGFEISGDKEGLQDWLIGARCRVLEGLALDVGYKGDMESENKIGTLGFHYEF